MMIENGWLATVTTCEHDMLSGPTHSPCIVCSRSRDGDARSLGQTLYSLAELARFVLFVLLVFFWFGDLMWSATNREDKNGADQRLSFLEQHRRWAPTVRLSVWRLSLHSGLILNVFFVFSHRLWCLACGRGRNFRCVVRLSNACGPYLPQASTMISPHLRQNLVVTKGKCGTVKSLCAIM